MSLRRHPISTPCQRLNISLNYFRNWLHCQEQINVSLFKSLDVQLKLIKEKISRKDGCLKVPQCCLKVPQPLSRPAPPCINLPRCWSLFLTTNCDKSVFRVDYLIGELFSEMNEVSFETKFVDQTSMVFALERKTKKVSQPAPPSPTAGLLSAHVVISRFFTSVTG